MKIYKSLAIGAISLSAIACTVNPITGRKSLQIANDSELAATALQQYQQTLKESKVISGTAQANSVVNVGTRIKNAAEKYYASIGRSADLANYNWEFHLLQEDQLNAWCEKPGRIR